MDRLRFHKKEQGRSFYEVGEDYINDLTNRSMIQSSYINIHSKKPTSICVHDMVHNLITRLSIEEAVQHTKNEDTPTITPNLQRRYCQTAINLIISSPGFPLPTLTSFHNKKPIFTIKFSKFIRLLDLDLQYCKELDNHYFKGICNLVLLRYLRLSSETITEIPEQIRKLHVLQILDTTRNKAYCNSVKSLQYTQNRGNYYILHIDVNRTGVDELPSTFIQLRKLLYLGFRCLKGIPVGFGDLKHLQELHGTITVKSTTMMHNLFELTKLRRLDLKFNEWDESYGKSFIIKCPSNLVSLEILELEGCTGDLGSQCDGLNPRPQQLRIIRIARSTIVRAVTRWMCSLHALSTLHITLQTLGAEDLHVLGSIPVLSLLRLTVEEPTQGRGEKLVITDAYPFLCLTSFEIWKNTGVAFAQGAMPKLQAPVLVFGVLETLANSGDFDFGLENLSSLVEVYVRMGYPKGKSDKVKGAEEAIRNALDMNPNKPMLYTNRVIILV
ncbi:hypothetical protein U9M48_002438 [Paspalum notatum var. saurae]|uniref:NB-ARC domain-containing protein n=1 Tax=Paspalum notatum var. saurae TaxID=547442 RepID=A0AAQ3PHQ6_PASNO